MSKTFRIASMVLIAGLLLAISYPTWRWLIGEWLGNDYYSHGLLVPFISAFLAWRLLRQHKREPDSKPDFAGLFLTVAALLLYLYAYLQRAYFIASVAMIGLLAGMVWFLAGRATLRKVAFPIGFLLFMVPLPFVERLSIPLAQWTGAASAWIVRVFGVPITVEGSQISLPNANLVVGAQCSGLRSIVTLLTLVALVVFLVRGPAWGKTLLALSSIPIAILGNVLRVTSLLVVAHFWGAEAGFTFYHDYSSIVFFLSAVVLLLVFSRWVQCREIREELF